MTSASRSAPALAALAAFLLALAPRAARAADAPGAPVEPTEGATDRSGETIEASPDKKEEIGKHAGFGLAVAPGVAVDTKGPRAGFNLVIEGTYGVGFGPLVIAPGATAELVVPKGTTVLMGFPVLKVLVPLGDFAPFGVFGVGIGTDTQTGDSGLAVRGGVGVHWSLSDAFGLQLDGAYLDLRDFKILSIGAGPVVQL